jgi:hypothetical protein
VFCWSGLPTFNRNWQSPSSDQSDDDYSTGLSDSGEDNILICEFQNQAFLKFRNTVL